MGEYPICPKCGSDKLQYPVDENGYIDWNGIVIVVCQECEYEFDDDDAIHSQQQQLCRRKGEV